MHEISEVLSSTRAGTGVTLEEVSKDLDIPVLVLTQIEEGNIGAFKDIFMLKEYIQSYAKYLGLDPDEVIDEFNEYMFEQTSKIPLDEIEKASREKAAEEAKDDRVASPYTKSVTAKKDKQLTVIIMITIIIVVAAIIWSLTQIIGY